MYICICNPFTDKDVSAHLSAKPAKARVKEVYTACSDGADMQCGTCACTLKKLVDTHNNARTIEALSGKMSDAAQKIQETI